MRENVLEIKAVLLLDLVQQPTAQGQEETSPWTSYSVISHSGVSSSCF